MSASPIGIGAAFDPDARLGFGAWSTATWREVASVKGGRSYLIGMRNSGAPRAPDGSSIRAGIAIEVCRRDGLFSLKACPRVVALAVVGYLASLRAGGVHALWLGFHYDDDDIPFVVDVEAAGVADLDAFARWLATEGNMPGFKSKAQMERCRGLVAEKKMTQEDFDAHVQASGDLSKLPDRLHAKK